MSVENNSTKHLVDVCNLPGISNQEDSYSCSIIVRLFPAKVVHVCIHDLYFSEAMLLVQSQAIRCRLETHCYALLVCFPDAPT